MDAVCCQGALGGVAWTGAKISDRMMRACGAICGKLCGADGVSLRAPMIMGDGRILQKPWEELPMMRRYWLADVVWWLDGFLGQSDMARVS